MGDAATPKIELAKSFPNSKVRKRFLKQMVPLHRLLDAHGFDCAFLVFSDSPTMLRISRNDQVMVVGLMDGDTSFKDTDLIFCVCLVKSVGKGVNGLDYIVRVNQLRGVIRTMWRWGVLGCDEIPEDNIDKAIEDARISCSACHGPQPCFGERFKQCKLCSETEKEQQIPDFRGYYCCSACQRSDWNQHKRAHHA
jgi:hypothetical protein